MRKCRSCGSLLLGEANACPRCGAELAVVTAGAAVAGKPPPAPWPPAPPAPPPPAPVAPAPPSWGPPPSWEPPPSSDSGPPALRESWQPVAVTAPTTRPPRSTKRGIIALVVAIALAVGAGVMHFRSDPLPAGTSEFASGGGVTYTSPDGTFEVQLPKPPDLDHESLNVKGMTATLYTAIASTDDYEIGGGSMVLPDSIAPAQTNDALDAMLTAAVKGAKGTSIRKVLTLHGSMPAIEGRFKDSRGFGAHMLVVLDGPDLIVLLVHAKSGVDRLYKALDASLIIR